ncbi:MAG: MFS transporter [Tabrizicola sp.]|jgi:sugar phosphate permease|nr:MFS transporter [Tabrizicola sp.]
MRAGLAALVFAYVLSQFYRAFLAVLTPVLEADLGATKADLATASGAWFLAFALMQIPVGEGLDRLGPRRTAAAALVVGALGAGVFAASTSPGMLTLAMVLIGIGCSPVLMASYYIFARQFSPAIFGTLAGATIGIGSLGNIGASLPLTAAVEAFGWRSTVWALAGVTALTGVLVAALVRDPVRASKEAGGSVLTLLRMPALWPIFAVMIVCYAPAAGLRGLWLGPYFADVHGYTQAQVGQAGLWMGLAMVAGSFAYGPLDRLLGTRKWVIFVGNALTLCCLAGLWLMPEAGPGLALVLFAGIGFFGATFPIVIGHGRAFLPPALTGRGVALINLCGIGSTGILQVVTGRIHATVAAGGVKDAAIPYLSIFAFYVLFIAAGLVIYLFARDRTD